MASNTADVAGLLDAMGRHEAADTVRWARVMQPSDLADEIDDLGVQLATVTGQFEYADAEVERLRAAMCPACRAVASSVDSCDV